MSSYLLIDEIKKRLVVELETWYLEHPVSNNIHRAIPNIMIGQLPPKTGSMPTTANVKQNSDSDFPFILIRPIESSFTSDEPCQQIFNIAIICGIHSSASYEKYERGIEEVINLMDKIVLSIKKYQLWGKNYFYHSDDIKCVFGLPKSIDPYESGLQAEAPYFASVVLTNFQRKINIPKVELNNIFS